MDPAAIARLDDVVRSQRARRLARAGQAVAGDGTIVYSDESRLIGERFELDDDELDVLANGRSDAGLSDLSEPENRYEDSATELLEVYVPVRTPERHAAAVRGLLPLRRRGRGGPAGVAAVRAGAARRAGARHAAADPVGGVAGPPPAPHPARSGRRCCARRSSRPTPSGAGSPPTSTTASCRTSPASRFSLGAAAREADVVRRRRRRAAPRRRRRCATRCGRCARCSSRSTRRASPRPASSRRCRTSRPGSRPRGIDTSLVVDGTGRRARPGHHPPALPHGPGGAAQRRGPRRRLAGRRVGGRRRDGVAVLEVADDGAGIEGDAVPAPEGHIGLKGLAGLAATMGASLMIDTTPGRGTTLRLEVPVR